MHDTIASVSAIRTREVGFGERSDAKVVLAKHTVQLLVHRGTFLRSGIVKLFGILRQNLLAKYRLNFITELLSEGIHIGRLMESQIALVAPLAEVVLAVLAQ